MTLMWRHRNRPGVPERDVELAGPPLENPTENYAPEGSQGEAPAVTPAKSWTKEKIQAWAAENGFELDPEGTKDQWLAQIAEKPSETPPADGESQETGDPTNVVNPEGVTPSGEGNA